MLQCGPILPRKPGLRYPPSTRNPRSAMRSAAGATDLCSVPSSGRVWAAKPARAGTYNSATVIRFSVRVPVLCTHNTVVAPRGSMAAIRRVRTCAQPVAPYPPEDHHQQDAGRQGYQRQPLNQPCSLLFEGRGLGCQVFECQADAAYFCQRTRGGYAHQSVPLHQQLAAKDTLASGGWPVRVRFYPPGTASSAIPP